MPVARAKTARIQGNAPIARSLLRPLLRGYEAVHLKMQRRQAALADRVERYAFMEMHTEDIVMRLDAKGIVKHVSHSVQPQLGYAPEELQGRRMLDFLHPDELPAWIEALKDSARSRQALIVEGNWRHKDGHYVTLEHSTRHAYGLNGAVVETISMGRNVQARNAMRDQLTRAAQTDHLTGLPNRAALVASLQKFRTTSSERPFVLFLFDLDRFKQVNDSLGHAAGDDYLIETANRVRSILRPGDTLARMGGDEFVALFESVDSEAGARSIAARIIDAVTRQDFDIEQQLTLALQQGRLALQFQPIVDAKSKQPVLAEALVRMRTEDGRLLGPGHFIDVAERTGQILQIGHWVLQQACWQARRLEEAGMAEHLDAQGLALRHPEDRPRLRA